jgi:hypothetical protein
MSSPRTETTVRPDTAVEKSKRTQLSPVQVAASALAAVSSAVVASFFGVAGTLIGAALASVIATVSGALYTESLTKTNTKLKRVLTGRSATPRSTSPAAGEDPATRALPVHLDPRRAPAQRRRPRWSRVAVYAVAVFVVAMGIVTGIELIGQKPVSALVGSSSPSDTTTLGELTNSSSHRATTPTAPSTPATTAPATPTADNSPATPTTSPGAGSPSATPTTTAPGASSPATPTAPTGAPTPSPAPNEGAVPTP